MSLLIALHSRGQQAGKDTAAKFVKGWCEEQGYSYERRAFADKMKLMVAETLGVSTADPEAALQLVDEFKLSGAAEWWVPGRDESRKLTGREFIVNLAGDSAETGARGLFGPNFWIDQCLPLTVVGLGRISADVTAITDLRFPEEAERVHEMGGVVVEIINPRAIDAGGRSEQGLPSSAIDFQITNAATLVEFGYRIRTMLGHYRHKLPAHI